MILVLERFVSTPEATFGMLLAGRYGLFTQEPPLHLCVPSGRYPICETVEGGKTYVITNGKHEVTVASRPFEEQFLENGKTGWRKTGPSTDRHLFLGFNLGIRHSEEGKRLILHQIKGAFGRFIQRMDGEQDPEIVIRWLGEG